MSNHRRTHIDACPIDEEPVSIEKCSPCRFFRGAAHLTGSKQTDWQVSCNWPRDGSEVVATPIPDAFMKAFFSGAEE